MSTEFAPAASIAGRYQIVDGSSADGTRYAGEADITAHGLFAHVTARLDPFGERHGLAAVHHGRLLVVWGPKDKVEIGAYRISGDQMHGIWVPPGATGSDLSACGDERSVRIDEHSWKIEKAHGISMEPYSGTITFSSVGESGGHGPRMVSILWKLHDGDYSSFGLLGKDWMVSAFNFEPGTPYGVSAYERIDGGWRGVQFWKDQSALAREQLVMA